MIPLMIAWTFCLLFEAIQDSARLGWINNPFWLFWRLDHWLKLLVLPLAGLAGWYLGGLILSTIPLYDKIMVVMVMLAWRYVFFDQLILGCFRKNRRK